MRFWASTILSGLSVLLSLPAEGVPQTRSPDPGTLLIETRMVEVPLSVASSSQRPLLNLTKENFLVFEDDRPQEIEEFGEVSNPFEVALILDTSGSTRSDLGLIQRAAEEFLRSLRPGDRVAVLSYRGDGAGRSRPEVVQGLTEDRTLLLNSLSKVGTSNGTPFYDSLLWVADEIFSERSPSEFRGRRAVVILTDGVDSVSSSTFSEARSVLEASGASIYFIKVDTREFFEKDLLGDCGSSSRFSVSQIRRFYERFYPGAAIEKVYDFCKLGDFERLAVSKGLYAIADAEMKSLAGRSGGSVMPVTRLAEAKDAFRKVAAEIGTRYSIVYYSNNETRDGSFRRIRIELKGVSEGVVVNAREGYYALPK